MATTMKKLFGIIVAVTLVTIISTIFMNDKPGRFFLQYSGILAISVMSIAMILATRPRWLENFLGGLDKGYHLHKWLGITAFCAAIFHWLQSEFPELFGGGDGEDGDEEHNEGEEEGSFSLSEIDFSSPENFLESFESPAHTYGELAFYALIILILIALIKFIPYRYFAKTHKVIPIAYLALVFHGIVLMKFDYWSTMAGVITAILMIAGSVSAILTLFGMKGRSLRTRATVINVKEYPKMDAVEVTVKPEGKWHGHKSGQFAFLTLNKNKEPHPFTISSSWNENDPKITFTIKALGNFTKKLKDNVTSGDLITIEGAYGHFNFEDNNQRQIWISGGIGVTPFLSRLEHLAQNQEDKQIDFFFLAKDVDAELMKRITILSKDANVTLHSYTNSTSGHFSYSELRNIIPDWIKSSIWFCGPKGLGDILYQDLRQNGLSKDSFHREIFDLR
ncbi:MAG: ferredoxin reductase family protein [Alphaproteobacteria bacterium]